MSAAELSATIQRVTNLPTTAMVSAVMAVKEVARTEAVRVAGSDRRLSNARGTMNVRDQTKGGTAIITAVPPHLWQWMTKGTRPHVIGFGRASSRGNRNYTKAMTHAKRTGGRTLRQRLLINGDWVTGPVFHPGTPGKNAWTNVVIRSKPVVTRIFADALDEAVR